MSDQESSTGAVTDEAVQYASWLWRHSVKNYGNVIDCLSEITGVDKSVCIEKVHECHDRGLVVIKDNTWYYEWHVDDPGALRKVSGIKNPSE